MKQHGAYAILLVITAVMIAGCVSTGQMQGRLSAQGQPAEPVVFNFKSDRSGEGGTLSTILPSGENFTGKYVQVTSTTSETTVAPMFQPWEPYWNNWGPYASPYGPPGSYQAFRTYYSGKVIATLFGNKGTTMRCRFTLSRPDSGFKGGGTGECQLSTGGTIDVQF